MTTNISTLKKELYDINNGGKNNTEHNNVEDEDRLTSLPDNLLITILSLLPLDSAAATSALSRRWRHLWTHRTHLHFSPFKNPKIDNYQKLVTLVDHIFSQINSPIIHSFELQMNYLSDNDKNQLCSSFLFPLITQICLRNPKVIDICFGYSFDSAHFFELPACLLTIQSLVFLKFDSKFVLKFPSNNINRVLSFNLPNLKELSLHLCDSNRHLMRIFFRSCPNLERLDLRLNVMENDHLVDIVASKLVYLKIHIEFVSLDLNCRIDAPNLEHFESTGLMPYCTFVNDLRVLKEVVVTLPLYYSNERIDYLRQVVPFLGGISFARQLEFSSDFSGLFLMDVALPIFHNLTDLKIVCDILKPGNRVPTCLLVNLKRVGIESMEPNDNEMRFLEELLSNAPVLEQLDVSVLSFREEYEVAEYKIGMEYKFCMTLFMLPRRSSNCLINFNGSIITASSNAFKNGVLVCKITNEIQEL